MKKKKWLCVKGCNDSGMTKNRANAKKCIEGFCYKRPVCMLLIHFFKGICLISVE